MKSENKKETARMLYLTTEKSQKEIAKIVGWTEAQFTKYKINEGWESMRDSKGYSKQQIISLLHIHTLKIIEQAKEESRVLSTKEVDSIAKLAVSIERMENKASIETYIEVFQEFNKWVCNIDIEFARKNNDFQDRFILSKIPK